jgi:hypothetical protein
VVHTYSPSFSGGRGRRISSLRPVVVVSKILSQKQNTNKSAAGMAKVVPKTTERERERKRGRREGM